MKVSLEYLKRDGLLLKHGVIPLLEDDERGVHIGVYDKSFFEDINEFTEMLFRIASITQDWYSDGDLESAYRWYQGDQSGRLSAWLDSAKRFKGRLVDWLPENGIEIDATLVPPEAHGKFYFDGDSAEFSMIIKNEQHFVDVFLADRT